MAEQHTDEVRWPFARSAGCPLDPPSQVAELRRTCPVTRVSLWDESRPWLMTRYDDIRAVFAHRASSSDTTRPGFPQPTDTLLEMRRQQRSLVRMDPPKHDEHRRMVMRDFTVPQAQTYKQFLDDLVRTLLDAMEASGPTVDLVKTLAQPVPTAVIAHLLDLPEEDTEFFQERMETWMSLDVTPEVSWQAASDVMDYFSELVDTRGQAPGDDLISRLITERLHTGELEKEELLHLLHTLVVGGFDTTANMITLGTIAFLDHPDQIDALRADPSLINSAVEELLRFLSVTHHTAYRLATEDMDVNGHTIKAGEGVIAPIYAANRDPERFPDPDAFDIRRDARGHLAFGFGVHQCLGQQFARLELQAVFSQLFERFPSLRLAVPADELVFSNAMVYGVKSLPLTWDQEN